MEKWRDRQTDSVIKNREVVGGGGGGCWNRENFQYSKTGSLYRSS